MRDVRWWRGPDVDAARLQKRVDAAEAALARGAENRKDGRRKESFLLALEGDAPDTLLKVNRYGDLPPWRRVGRSKSREELERAVALAARGIPTVVPIAAGERRRRGLLDRCYGLVPWLPDAIDLLRAWTESRGDAAERRAWTRALGTLVRRMHDAGVQQDDLAPNNFLWRPTGEPRLLAIDFERARVTNRVGDADRAFALAKLDRHFAGAPATGRLRFLLAYAGGDRDAARRWWRAIAAEVPRLARRDVAHWSRTGTRRGRRYDRVALDAWRGFARRDAPMDALRARLASGAPATPNGDGLLARRLDVASERDARRTWGLALALHQRRLVPTPVALLRAAGATIFVMGDAGALVPLADAPARHREAALVVALDRLLAVGLDAARLSLGAFAFDARTRRALVLDPRLCKPGARGEHGRRAARALARRLLGRPESN